MPEMGFCWFNIYSSNTAVSCKHLAKLSLSPPHSSTLTLLVFYLSVSPPRAFFLAVSSHRRKPAEDLISLPSLHSFVFIFFLEDQLLSFLQQCKAFVLFYFDPAIFLSPGLHLKDITRWINLVCSSSQAFTAATLAEVFMGVCWTCVF